MNHPAPLFEERSRTDQRLTILVVDDSPGSVKVLVSILERDFRVVVATSSGHEALQRAATNPPAMILLDIIMPEMDGFAVCEQLQAMEATREIPIIFLTVKNSPEDETYGLALGAVDFISKPYSPSVVLARIKTHLSVRSTCQMLEQKNSFLTEQHVQLHEANESRLAINKLLMTMLNPVSLEEQLQAVLTIIFSVSWFDLQPKGAIFLLDGDSAELTLLVQHGFNTAHRAACARIKAGQCLCGKTLQSKTLLFSPCVDDQHEIRLENMQPHGHYCVPIMDRDQCLGVINLYLLPDHLPRPEEEAFLLTAAHTVAGLINHRNLEKQLDQQAKFDHLTGLPNRFLFHDRLQQVVSMAVRDRRDVVLMFIDLDRFKLVNDSLGHEAGDCLLQEASQRITNCLRRSDTVARLGGDEFTVILQDLTSPYYVELVARKILEQLANPFLLLGEEVALSGSMGITFFPHDATDVESMLKNADSAMYQAKKAGRSTFCFFTQAMQDQATQRMQMEKELLQALERGEFCLHYQAKASCQSGHITGMEALVRWEKPGEGLVAPGAFIHVAEETGMIVPLGVWILRTACQQTKAWIDVNQQPMRVAVNLSARQFQQGEALIDTINSVLSETGLAAECLELEITESMVMASVTEAVVTMKALQAMGIHISLDDFGTGYSSLGALKRFPLHALKIDRSFVTGLPNDPEDAAIVTAIISMAHNMNLTVIAEGVERSEQLAFLRQHECDQIQGYYFSRPLPVDAFTRLLEEKRSLCSGESV